LEFVLDKSKLFTSEEKIRLAYRIVTEMLGGKSIAQASKLVGLNKARVYSWIKRENTEGLLIKTALDNSQPVSSSGEFSRKPILEETLEQKIKRFLVPSVIVSAPKLPHKDGGNEERVCLLLSDLHVGRRTPTFNSNVYIDRMSQLYESLERIVRLHRNNSVLRIIHVFDAGDNVHGERVGQQGRMNDFEFGIPEQLAMSTSVMGELIDKLLGLFDEVHWHDAPGNHGNLDKIYSAGSNWDIVRVNLMENLKKNQGRIFFHRPPHINRVAFSIAEVMNHKFLVTHGDTIKSYGGFPFASVIKKMEHWRFIEHFDVAVLGHFHTPNVLSFNGMPIIMNGTLVSHDEYALQLGYDSPPSQTIFGTSEKYPVTWLYQIPFE